MDSLKKKNKVLKVAPKIVKNTRKSNNIAKKGLTDDKFIDDCLNNNISEDIETVNLHKNCDSPKMSLSELSSSGFKINDDLKSIIDVARDVSKTLPAQLISHRKCESPEITMSELAPLGLNIEKGLKSTRDDLTNSEWDIGIRNELQQENDRVSNDSEHDELPNNKELQEDLQNSRIHKKPNKHSRKKLLQEAWKVEVSKDIAKLTNKMCCLEKEFKGVKRQLKKMAKSEAASISSYEEDDFSLIPELPITKRKQLRTMEHNVLNDAEYKRQLIGKLYTIGGADIKENIINIFDDLFTPKLRSKICWIGSSKGKGKIAFHPFKGLREVIRKSVRKEFGCTRTQSDNECKLRFKQADKDYAREREKQNRLLL